MQHSGQKWPCPSWSTQTGGEDRLQTSHHSIHYITEHGGRSREGDQQTPGVSGVSSQLTLWEEVGSGRCVSLKTELPETKDQGM